MRVQNDYSIIEKRALRSNEKLRPLRHRKPVLGLPRFSGPNLLATTPSHRLASNPPPVVLYGCLIQFFTDQWELWPPCNTILYPQAFNSPSSLQIRFSSSAMPILPFGPPPFAPPSLSAFFNLIHIHSRRP